ncbi:hypothetical protein JOQ06_018334, partial [Pogonophryne albipinna]
AASAQAPARGEDHASSTVSVSAPGCECVLRLHSRRGWEKLSGVTDATTESEYLAPGGQEELDSAKASPPGQDQAVLSGVSAVS